MRKESVGYWVVLIFQYDVQRVDDTRDVTQNGEQYVDAEISTASSL